MTVLSSFDDHDHIIYRDASKAYWSEYIFKVSIKGDGLLVYNKNQDLKKEVYAFCDQHCKKWKTIIGNFTINLFFVDAEDAKRVIDHFSERVTVVERPRNESAKAALMEFGTIVRNTLYRKHFRWRVDFKSDDESEEVVDNWMLELYQSNAEIKRLGKSQETDRFYYSFYKANCAYFKNHSDVVYIKMALTDHIKSITKIILKKEIGDEHDIEQTTR